MRGRHQHSLLCAFSLALASAAEPDSELVSTCPVDNPECAKEDVQVSDAPEITNTTMTVTFPASIPSDVREIQIYRWRGQMGRFKQKANSTNSYIPICIDLLASALVFALCLDLMLVLASSLMFVLIH
eukprot:gnl/TRDRNA2_/TRDRNA2_86737_c0_seq1.p1 gnl/TRDRNA2_/TRDRNA2_86737_c0~~gnl/TRDRNA2_/TRDRNA2_86737_c0_seq1.p1  ORF type:complete len:128 (+),score=15.53 gnl/TRDRNA2_/TRDRNA2_86737_c0_seq1:50-433(+)